MQVFKLSYFKDYSIPIGLYFFSCLVCIRFTVILFLVMFCFQNAYTWLSNLTQGQHLKRFYFYTFFRQWEVGIELQFLKENVVMIGWLRFPSGSIVCDFLVKINRSLDIASVLDDDVGSWLQMAQTP